MVDGFLRFHRVPPSLTFSVTLYSLSRPTRQVIDLVRRHERQDRTIVGAFADWTGQQLRQRAPDIPRIFSAKESLLIYLKYFTGAVRGHDVLPTRTLLF